MAREQYEAQVRLLVRTLPFIAAEQVFALKGGTAINLFYRDFPRLSVDIDLTYLPVRPRPESLAEIDDTLNRIAAAVDAGLPNVKAQRIAGGGGGETRLEVRQQGAAVKVETSPVARGTVHPPRIMRIKESVEEKFGFAEMQVLAFEDLYGGKLHAALDRQHPRDLYDVKLLYDNEGFTDALFRTFLVYVASSGRPMHELLSPNLADLDAPFAREFEGMTVVPVPLKELIETRVRLIGDIRDKLDDSAMRFLLALHDGVPDFGIIGSPQAADLPAVQWKIRNLQKLLNENAEKHAEQRQLILELSG